ncbi:MAG: signal peptidase II [Pseudomonadota bacterium]
MRKDHALPWLSLAAVIIVADQATKWLAIEHLDYARSVAVFPGLNWTLLHNYGAAFSFLNFPGGSQRWLFTGLALVISVVLLVWLSRTARSDWRTAAPLALIVGGAIGNVIDRLRLGYVIDFVDVYYRSWHWPAFNIADSAITVAAVLLLLYGWRNEEDEENPAKSR